MAISVKKAGVGKGKTAVTPASSTIPNRPEKFIFDDSLKKLTWAMDSNSVTAARADYFEVWRSTTNFNGAYTRIKDVDNPTSGSVSYLDPLEFQGYWYRIRAVNAGGEKSWFTHEVEYKENAEHCWVIGVVVDINGSPIGDAEIKAEVKGVTVYPLDGNQTFLGAVPETVKSNSVSGFFALKLLRSSKIDNKQYTFSIFSKNLSSVLTGDLTVPDSKEAWLTVTTAGILTIAARTY